MTKEPDPSDSFARDAATGVPAGRVLVVDDERNIRSTLKMVLAGEGYAVDVAQDGDEAERVLAATPPDVVLLDVRMPGRSGLELLAAWRTQHPAMPVIMMSGEATLTEATQGLKLGAYDFLEKPLLHARVVNAVLRAVERSRLVGRGEGEGDGIVGQAAALKTLLAQVEKIAPLRTRVLVTGESGTGKDLVAKLIHQLSARRDKRYVKVNCAAIPGELIESELFGHVKGAFTGAAAARRGYFESANGGTLFLDEVGELSASAQAKILRALQNGEITPVGSDLTITVDVRVVAATNRDLKTAVELGTFREDLYYRLAVVCLAVPPLRERSLDVPALVRHFAAKVAHENGLPDKEFALEVLQALTSYPWPGNIRELRNAVERLVILGGPEIQLEDLPVELRRTATPAASPLDQAAPRAYRPLPWEAFKSQSERAYLVQTLKHCSGNISEAARVLGVERTTIHKWLKTYQIDKHHYVV